jgi:aromatic-amino-acid transaminase
VPEAIVTVSCSKNFALYRERTGLIIALSASPEAASRTLGRLKKLARVNHSMPPDHGAAVVATILTDPALRRAWEGELAAMRERIAGLRRALAEECRRQLNSARFDFVGSDEGMFSMLGITPEQVARLRADHAIYMVASGRMNIAGLKTADIPVFVAALAAVLRG